MKNALCPLYVVRQFDFESLAVFACNTISLFSVLIVEGKPMEQNDCKGEYRGLTLSNPQCMNI